MQDHLDLAKFRHLQLPPVRSRGLVDLETVAKLLQGQRMVAKTRFKAWVSRLFPLLDAPKKRLMCQIHSFHHILEHLRRHGGQFRAHLFAAREFRALIFVGERNPDHPIGAFALIKRRIVRLAAQHQPSLQLLLLLASRVQAELVASGWLFLFFRFLSLRHVFAAQYTV